MCCQVLVSFLISGIFGYEVEIFTTDDKGSVHFGRNDCASQDTSADGDLAGERAFLVYEVRSDIALFLTCVSLAQSFYKTIKAYLCRCLQSQSLVS